MRIALLIVLVGLASMGVAGAVAASPAAAIPPGMPVENHICVPLTNICPSHPDVFQLIDYLIGLL